MEINLTTVWPDWEIVEPIGKGAFGHVYKAIRKKNDDIAAVKIISLPQNMEEIEAKRQQYSDETIKASYRDQAKEVLEEIKIMKELVGSSNIVGIQDYELVEKSGGIGYDIYIRMELLQPMKKHHDDLEISHNCAQYILPEEEIIKIGIDICRALETCHNVTTETKKQIIHRDIKPENILYHKNSDSYKLGDFGVSKELEAADSNLTQSIGTLKYMAPEVLHSIHYDSKADIYSLGLVLYVLANKKRLPFAMVAGRHKEEVESIERRMAGENLPAPEFVSSRLAAVILKACSYNAEDRYASAKEFRIALQTLTTTSLSKQDMHEKPISQNNVVPAPKVNEFGPKKRKHKGFWIASVVLGLLVTGLLATKFNPNTLKSLQGSSLENNTSKTSNLISSTTQKPKQGVTKLFGTSKENATIITLDNLYDIKVEESEDWEHWCQLNTSSNPSNYFLTFSGIDPTFAVNIEVLNNDLEIISSGWSRDQKREIGTYLQPNTSYWIRISGSEEITSYQFEVEEKICDAGKSRKTALPIQLNTEYKKSITVNGEDDWYIFTTSDNESIYRIFVNSKADNTPVNGETIFTLYDAEGIKQKQGALGYEQSGYFDIHLSPKTSFTLKISAKNTVSATGNYLLRVTENPIDAGLDQNTAKPLDIGSQYRGKLDSSLSDWFVFTFKKGGKYVLDFHNIDTGCKVNIRGLLELKEADFSRLAKNEDSESIEFTVEAGEKLYLEIKPCDINDAAVVNGAYIINITEQEVA